MPSCDMCGKETELYEVSVEGSIMRTCSSCASFGKILSMPKQNKPFKKAKKQVPKEETVEEVIDNFSEKIRKIREKKGLTQKEFAKLISERESLVHKMETKGFKPSLTTAKKLERLFKVKLTQLEPEKKGIIDKKKSKTGFTLGDFIKVK